MEWVVGKCGWKLMDYEGSSDFGRKISGFGIF